MQRVTLTGIVPATTNVIAPSWHPHCGHVNPRYSNSNACIRAKMAGPAVKMASGCYILCTPADVSPRNRKSTTIGQALIFA
jgi:hypothetical protein